MTFDVSQDSGLAEVCTLWVLSSFVNFILYTLFQIWLIQILPEPDQAGFRNSNPARVRFGENNTPDETNGVNNADFC